jgi:hypothetical protein
LDTELTDVLLEANTVLRRAARQAAQRYSAASNDEDRARFAGVVGRCEGTIKAFNKEIAEEAENQGRIDFTPTNGREFANQVLNSSLGRNG